MIHTNNPTKSDNPGTFATRIKDLRLIKRYTQEHVSSVLGIPRSVYVNIEQGKRDLKWRELRVLASLYDMSMDDFTYGNNPTEHHKAGSMGKLRDKITMAVYPSCRLIETTGGSMGSSLFTVDKDGVRILVDNIMQLIQQEVGKAKIDARLSERKEIALDNYRGHTFSADTNWEGKFNKFMDNNEKRIEQLAKLQEEQK